MSAVVELFGGDSPRLVDLLGVGKALPCEGCVAEEPPPSLLQLEPTRPGQGEDVVKVQMKVSGYNQHGDRPTSNILYGKSNLAESCHNLVLQGMYLDASFQKAQ